MNYYDTTKSKKLVEPLFLGCVASLSLHLIGFFLIFSKAKIDNYSSKSFLVEINISPEIDKTTPKQIVSETLQEESQPEKIPTLLSEKDISAVKEEIRRGDGAGDINTKSIASQTSPPTAVKEKSAIINKQHYSPDQHAPSPQIELKDKNLFLDQKTVLRNFSDTSQENSLNDTRLTPQAFTRPSGSGAQFIGLGGSADYLPHLPDGDLTLLNAKAEKFAVFVRRVALQVFTALKLSGWERLRRSDLLQIKEESTVIALLSRDGKQLQVKMISGSGSPLFDKTVELSVKEGAYDQNPPTAALAADGNIRFIFKAKSWSRLDANFRERRWLLLATGLE
jgi:hypothetical protein